MDDQEFAANMDYVPMFSFVTYRINHFGIVLLYDNI